jgi:hypothetical protein
MFKKAMYILMVVALSTMFSTSCLDNEDNNRETDSLHLNLSNMPYLGNNYVYEGWLVFDGKIASTGRFTVSEEDNSGSITMFAFSDQLEDASEFIVTIEPYPDPYQSPSHSRILAGTFSGDSAQLSHSHKSALGTDFSSATGQYILATPTNGEESDELSGIWWLDPSGPSASLDLPMLNNGWIYEGWVIQQGNYLSAGKFFETDTSDFEANFSDTLAPAPAFPGEDFLTNAPAGVTFPLNLAGEIVMITVEPNPDTGTEPFAVIPLRGEIPLMATDHTLYDMENVSDTIAFSGSVVRFGNHE